MSPSVDSSTLFELQKLKIYLICFSLPSSIVKMTRFRCIAFICLFSIATCSPPDADERASSFSNEFEPIQNDRRPRSLPAAVAPVSVPFVPVPAASVPVVAPEAKCLIFCRCGCKAPNCCTGCRSCISRLIRPSRPAYTSSSQETHFQLTNHTVSGTVGGPGPMMCLKHCPCGCTELTCCGPCKPCDNLSIRCNKFCKCGCTDPSCCGPCKECATITSSHHSNHNHISASSNSSTVISGSNLKPVTGMVIHQSTGKPIPLNGWSVNLNPKSKKKNVKRKFHS